MGTGVPAIPRIRADCADCPVRGHTEWCALSDIELHTIDTAKVGRQYMPGDVLYHEGDKSTGIFCVQSGMVGIRKSDAEGNSILVRLGYPGGTLGYRSFLCGEDHTNSAEVLKPGVICHIDGAPIRRILEVNPNLGLRFLQRASHDLGEADERLMQSVTMSVRARFAHLLLILQGRYSPDVADGANGTVSFELPLSRQDMAAMIGARPETMSRTIKQMQDDGIAHFNGRGVTIPEIDALVQEIDNHFAL